MDDDRIEIVFQTEASIERKVISLLAFLIGGYAILTAAQLLITFALLDFPSWINQTFSDSLVSYGVIIFSLLAGVWLVSGLLFRKIKVVRSGLLVLGIYQLLMALLNGVAYAFQGTPFFPYLLVGMFCLVLLAYYSERPGKDELTRGDIDAILPNRSDFNNEHSNGQGTGDTA